MNKNITESVADRDLNGLIEIGIDLSRDRKMKR